MQKVVPIGFRTDCCTMSRCLFLYRTMQVLHRVCSHACLTIFRYRVYSPFGIGFVCIRNIFRHWIHPESESALFPCSLWHRVYSYSASGLFPCSHRHRVHSRLNICLSRVGIGFVPMLTWVAGLFLCGIGFVPMLSSVSDSLPLGIGFYLHVYS